MPTHGGNDLGRGHTLAAKGCPPYGKRMTLVLASEKSSSGFYASALALARPTDLAAVEPFTQNEPIFGLYRGRCPLAYLATNVRPLLRSDDYVDKQIK